MNRKTTRLERLARLLSALLVAALAVGCGGAGDSQQGERVDELPSEQEDFLASFTHDPPSPQTGENALNIELWDADGEAVGGAEISVEPWMPAHGHGSPEAPQVMEVDEGAYLVSNIVYSMPGSWELRVDVSVDGASDRFIVTYQVQ